MNLPWRLDTEEFKELNKKEIFYVCLIQMTKSFDRYKRILEPTKIVNIEVSDYRQTYLVPEKGKKIRYTSEIEYFFTYEECAKSFNNQIDGICQDYKEKIDKMRAKYNDMVSKKVNIRSLKLDQILKE